MGRKIITNANNCPMTHAMNILGGKWKPIILYLLSNGKLRFGRFFIFIPSISRKVLTDQLRELETDGLIIRKKYAEIPPRVEYSLSRKGETLIPILERLTEWIAENDMFESCKLKP